MSDLFWGIIIILMGIVGAYSTYPELHKHVLSILLIPTLFIIINILSIPYMYFWKKDIEKRDLTVSIILLTYIIVVFIGILYSGGFIIGR
jgi:hypothetical protein